MAIAVNNPIPLKSTILDALLQCRFSKGISRCIPPPGFTTRASSPTKNELFNIMTNGEGVALFKDKISKLDGGKLHLLASLLTSESDYFMEVVGNKNGSRRVQKVLGKSDEADALFYAAILRRFLCIMTDKYASYVATRAMVVFDEKKKKGMYEHVLHHALDIARDQHGCIALNDIITDADDDYYRDQILDLVARNALCLSNDASGNFVVQHVLKLSHYRTKINIAFNLCGHFVDLSFKKYGSYIVEQLLEESYYSMVEVVTELLGCQGERLVRLARNEFGNFVVVKALKVTLEIHRMDLFWDLFFKLMPFLHLLRRSHRSNITHFLESHLLLLHDN